MHSGSARRLASLGLIAALIACAHAGAATQAPGGYGLGHPAAPALITREDIDVSPDGSGLPDGRGDAVDGAALFAAACAACHGVAIRLDPERWPFSTTLFDYIRRAMPPGRTRALRADEVYALTAYELQMNGTLQPHELLDKITLPRVIMPGNANFLKQP